VQQWHDARETSSEELGPKEIVDQEYIHCRRDNDDPPCKSGWRREKFIRKDCTRANDERVSQRVGPLRKNLQMPHEEKCGTKDLCGGQPFYLRKEWTTTKGIRGWRTGQ
jgi:hypothetical protein